MSYTSRVFIPANYIATHMLLRFHLNCSPAKPAHVDYGTTAKFECLLSIVSTNIYNINVHDQNTECTTA